MVKRSTIRHRVIFGCRRGVSLHGLLLALCVLFTCAAVLGGASVLVSCKPAVEPEADSSDTPVVPEEGQPPVLTGANGAIVLPWTVYEAEDGFGGAFAGPSMAYGTVAAEASGRKYALLSAVGETLSWTAAGSANSIVVRFTVPDTTLAVSDAAGGNVGTLAPLEVLVNGSVAATLQLSSSTSWVYGGFRWDAAGTWTTDRWANDPSASVPAGGAPHHFFDEAHALLSVLVRAGDTIAVRKADSSTDYIGIDFAELELVDEPLTQPEGSLSFAGYSPAADGVTDDTAKLVQCIADAKSQGKTVWVPEGTYRIGSVDAANVTIRGAGMWYTAFTGKYARFNCTGGNLGFYDFAVFGDASTRNDDSGLENAFDGHPGSGSILERIWVEHKKCAFWVGLWNNASAPDSLAIRECRFRNLMADAVNLCNGTSNSVIEGCFVRNTGDDALAVWSPAGGGPLAENNAICGNVIQNPWFANGIALYGGKNLTVEGNDVFDTLITGSGIYVAASFGAKPFGGTVSVTGNRMLRCGSATSDAGGAAGALRFVAGDANMTAASFAVTDNDISDSVCQGLSVQTASGYSLTGLRVTDLRITDSGTYGIEIKSGASGSASFGAVSVASSGSSAWRKLSSAFTVTDLGNNEGWSP